MSTPTYLGDSVYLDLDLHSLCLYIKDDGEVTDTIMLGEEVLQRMDEARRKLPTDHPYHLTGEDKPLVVTCLDCDGTEWKIGEQELTQEFRGETLLMKSPVTACCKCGFMILGTGQLDELKRRTHAAYLEKHPDATFLK